MVKFLLVVACVLIALCSARPGEKYTDKYDSVDLDSIFKSDRLLNNYVNCLMDKGKCTPDASELKKVIPDAILTDCLKCSEKQKELSKKTLRFLVKEKRPIFDKLIAKYDPEGVYRAKYKDEYEKEGIVL